MGIRSAICNLKFSAAGGSGSGAGNLTNYSPANKKAATAVVLVAMIWLTAAFLTASCGKKGPPQPPSGNKPPPVTDLAYSVTGSTIKLSWTIPPTTDKAKSPAAGFLIFRYQQPVYERECPSCPVIFRQVGDVPARGQPGVTPLVFTQTIELGYRYIYKVKAYDNGGIPSRDSNFVQFIF
jgi:predicted small lipoprotein YifL